MARRPEIYDIEVVNSDRDLEALINALAGAPSPRATMCLSGPPGTGKTAFAHHMARRLKRPIMSACASDLMGPFVGMTEAAIAYLFSCARNEDAVLLLDEADSFLQNRANAHMSWEITVVNEMLTQMEAFEGVFICATNLRDILDPASTRRFDLKISFEYMNPDQAMRVFQHVAEKMNLVVEGRVEIREKLARIRRLTPGDFAVVMRQARIYGVPADMNTILAALNTESRAKPERKGRVAGFAT